MKTYKNSENKEKNIKFNIDKDFENKIRPLSFDEFSGQEKVKENLRIFVQAAKIRKEPLDHILLYGPPGLGKTTLANIIANEMNTKIKITSGPIIEKVGDMAGILTNLEKNEILFIDEIHRLNRTVEEFLYSAMEDFKIDIMIDKGPAARSIEIKINPFTLIGATTRAGMLTKPLRSRFGINAHLEYYNINDIEKIIKRTAKILEIEIEDKAAEEISKRSRGTPRIANYLLKRVRDFAMVKGNGKIDIDIVNYALDRMDIDKLGLDEMDNKILRTIIEKFNGGPVGLTTLAIAVGEDEGTIEEVYEPYLIKEGFIKKTQRGRIATEKTYKHLGKFFGNISFL